MIGTKRPYTALAPSRSTSCNADIAIATAGSDVMTKRAKAHHVGSSAAAALAPPRPSQVTEYIPTDLQDPNRVSKDAMQIEATSSDLRWAALDLQQVYEVAKRGAREGVQMYFETQNRIGGKNAEIGGKSSFHQPLGGRKFEGQCSATSDRGRRRTWECDASDEWLEDGKASGTLRKYKGHMDNFYDFLRNLEHHGEDVPSPGKKCWYECVTESDLRKWRAHVIKVASETKSASIPHYRITAVKSFFKCLCERRRIKHENPARYIRTPSKASRQKRAHRMTEAEAERVIETARKRGPIDSGLVALTYFGMVRRKEARSVSRDDCALVGEGLCKVLSIKIQDGKGRDSKTRTVKLSKRGTDLLMPLVGATAQGKWLFPGRNGRYPVSLNTVYNRLKAVLRESGLENASPHSLRHAGASIAHSKGASLASLRDMLGHSNVQVTNTYLHTQNESAGDYLDSGAGVGPETNCNDRAPRVVD